MKLLYNEYERLPARGPRLNNFMTMPWNPEVIGPCLKSNRPDLNVDLVGDLTQAIYLYSICPAIALTHFVIDALAGGPSC